MNWGENSGKDKILGRASAKREVSGVMRQQNSSLLVMDQNVDTGYQPRGLLNFNFMFEIV